MRCLFESNLPVKHTTTTTMKRRLRRKVEIDAPLGQTSSAHATITDLPDELVEKIVEDLDDNGSICRLSLTCKRLHFLVLPTFFSRNKLENVQNGAFHCCDPVPELLEAIRTALFIRNLSTFTFYFNSGIEQVISDIYSLRGLLTRIPPVGEIQLGLPACIRYSYEPELVRNLKMWGREFLKLLETIAQSGCRNLKLFDSRFARDVICLWTICMSRHLLPQNRQALSLGGREVWVWGGYVHTPA